MSGAKFEIWRETIVFQWIVILLKKRWEAEHVHIYTELIHLVGSVFLVHDDQNEKIYALKQIRVNDSDIGGILFYQNELIL